MAAKRNHGDGHPSFPVQQVYKFDKTVDQAVTQDPSLYNVSQFNIDTGEKVVSEGQFKKRRDAQIANRKRQGM